MSEEAHERDRKIAFNAFAAAYMGERCDGDGDLDRNAVEDVCEAFFDHWWSTRSLEPGGIVFLDADEYEQADYWLKKGGHTWER